MYGIIIFSFFALIILWAIKTRLSQSPYGRSIRLPFGRHLFLRRALPFTAPADIRTEAPKLSPLTICYLQGQGMSPRLMLVAILTLASKGYLILRRDPDDGRFSLLRRDDGAQAPLNNVEQIAFSSLFPDENPELAINIHATTCLRSLHQSLNQALSDKFASKKRGIPAKWLLAGIGLSVLAQIAIAITGRFGMQTVWLPFVLILCPLGFMLFGGAFYTSLRAFYHQRFDHHAERSISFGIGTASILLVWLLSLAVALWSYGILSFLALLGVQMLSLIGLLLCHQPPADAMSGHKAIAAAIERLSTGMDTTGQDIQPLDENSLLLALATGTELDWLCPDHREKTLQKAMAAQSTQEPATDTESDDDYSATRKKRGSQMAAMMRKLQGMVPVFYTPFRLALPDWLDITEDRLIQPDALANILGEVLVMEQTTTLATFPTRKTS